MLNRLVRYLFPLRYPFLIPGLVATSFRLITLSFFPPPPPSKYAISLDLSMQPKTTRHQCDYFYIYKIEAKRYFCVNVSDTFYVIQTQYIILSFFIMLISLFHQLKIGYTFCKLAGDVEQFFYFSFTFGMKDNV